MDLSGTAAHPAPHSRRRFLRIGTIGALGLAVASVGRVASEGTPEAGESSHGAHWTYEDPEHWGDLSPDYGACSTGSAQSPIDITGTTPGDLDDIAVDWQTIPEITIGNNGHTIQVDLPPGSTTTLGDVTYELLQFHIHSPSEHLVDGLSHPLELHLVHEIHNDTRLVLGIFLQEGAENTVLGPVLGNLPAGPGETVTVGEPLELASLLPASQTAYRYSGSLTTPPCTENVLWVVFTEPVELSAGQIELFHQVYVENARPMQDRGDRPIDEGE